MMEKGEEEKKRETLDRRNYSNSSTEESKWAQSPISNQEAGSCQEKENPFFPMECQ